MRQNKRKGIICFDASLHGKPAEGLGGRRSPPEIANRTPEDGFGKDSDGARLTKVAAAWGFATICKQSARMMGLEGIQMVFGVSLHGLKQKGGGRSPAPPICKHNAGLIGLEGIHMLRSGLKKTQRGVEGEAAPPFANTTLARQIWKGIICFDASLDGLKQRGVPICKRNARTMGLERILMVCTAKKKGGLGGGVTTICKPIGLEGIHTVFEGSLHGFKSVKSGGFGL